MVESLNVNISIFLFLLNIPIALSFINETIFDKFDCTQPDPDSEVSGSVLYIPYKSDNTVVIPSNFDCKYSINIKLRNWVRITVLNDITGPSDYIQINDGLKNLSRIDSKTQRHSQFYFISNSTSSITVHTNASSSSSSVLIKLEYFSLSSEKVMEMTRNGRVNYVDLNKVSNAPVTVIGKEGEKIVASVAISGYSSDDFAAFYVFDGNISVHSGIFRLDDYLTGSNIVSTGNMLTVVGLSSDISMSSIIFHYFNDVSSYDKLAGVTVADQYGTVKIASSRQKTAVTFLSRNTDVLLLDSMKFTDLGNGQPACTTKTITGSPNDLSKDLIDFSPSTQQIHILPQLFPAKFFTILVEHCSLQLSIGNRPSNDYYDVTDGQTGYIFSPSYLDPQASSNFNVTYVYNSTQTIQFSIDIESVRISRNVELDISVNTKDMTKELSIVVTGDQSGTKSRAEGNSLNVEMKGSVGNDGYARLKYSVQSSCFRHSIAHILMFSLLSGFL